ncbi:MAG: HAD-IA family hydrolase [Actinomycetota bacterium]|nr:HAD-IA family hydrolase [Actinomycetota bacterium]
MSSALHDRRFAAFLFDMDGTVIDSIAAANRIWARWATGHGLDPSEVLAVIHGVRAADTIRRFTPPGTDVDLEAERLTRAEIDDLDGVIEIPGARRFLDSLPPDRWAIVTSAPRELARRRMAAAGVPIPEVLVTAEDVRRGKPFPDAFIAAAETLGVLVADCLIWEDSPAGIAAAEASGGSVIVVSATHAEPISTQHPTIKDYESLVVDVDPDGQLRVRPTN